MSANVRERRRLGRRICMPSHGIGARARLLGAAGVAAGAPYPPLKATRRGPLLQQPAAPAPPPAARPLTMPAWRSTL
jgi:hypothetical protein